MIWLDGITDSMHEFEQAPVVGDGQWSLKCSVHGLIKSRTQLRNWNELNRRYYPNGSLWLSCEESTGDAGDDSIPGLRITPQGGNSNPVFLPGKSNGQRSLAGCSPQGHRVGHDWATEHTHMCYSIQRLIFIIILWVSNYPYPYLTDETFEGWRH